MAAARLGGQCVFAAEIDESLRSLYKENFGLDPAGDICQVRPRDVPAHDLLCAGFPCQPFSKAGEQIGFRDRVRGTVLFDLLEVLRVVRPRHVILENVPHFIRHKGGKTYRVLTSALEALGYSIDARELSPHQFGIPQVRWRMYLVGRLGSLESFKWPNPTHGTDDVDIGAVLDRKPVDAARLSSQSVKCIELWQQFLQRFPPNSKLPSFPIWSMEFGATYPVDKDSLAQVPLNELRKGRGSFGQSLKGLRRSEIMLLVPSHARAAQGAFPRWKQTFIRQNRDLFAEHRAWLTPWLSAVKELPPSLQKCEWNCQGESRDIWRYVLQFRASGLRIKRRSTAPSLVAMTTTQVPIIGWERRFMSIKECARLQDLGTLGSLPQGAAGFKALGNAVCARVVEQILTSLVGQRTRKRTPPSRIRLSRSALAASVR